MPNAPDLPAEILEVIFKHLLKIHVPTFMSLTSWSDQGRSFDQKLADRLSQVKQLRLVCASWADLLYQRHLYDTLSFGDSGAAADLTNGLTRRPENLQRPQCRYLKVHHILMSWTPLLKRGIYLSRRRLTGSINPKIEDLNALVDRFSETIIGVEIGVLYLFTLPMATIERIGRIPNLRFLRLGFEFMNGEYHREDMPQSAVGLPTDSECLISLLKAARGVTSLDLTNLRPVCPPGLLERNLGDLQFTHIKTLKLELSNTSRLPTDGIERLAARMPNVTELFIGRFRMESHAQDLLPIFEILRGKLEEISVTDLRVLRPMLQLEFPRLRVLKLHQWGIHLNDFLQQRMFANAPLTVLALCCLQFPEESYRNILLPVPFQALPHLRRIEIHDAWGSKFPPRSDYQAQCESHQVECVFFPPRQVGENELPSVDLPSEFLTQLWI